MSLTDEGRRVWCTVTVLGSGRPEIVAASGEQAGAQRVVRLRFTDMSYLRAVREQTLIHVGETGIDRRWALSATTAADQGIRSVLLVPF